MNHYGVYMYNITVGWHRFDVAIDVLTHTTVCITYMLVSCVFRCLGYVAVKMGIKLC